MNSTKTIAERRWTVDLPDRYRFNARAALDHIEGNRRPHFTTTGELLNLRRRGDNQIEACGQMQEETRAHFPEMAPLLAIHSSDDDGTPMHALENARYWFGLCYFDPKTRLRPMSPHTEYSNQTFETDPVDGREWAPETVARHLRVTIPQAREWRAYITSDPNESEALRYMIRTLSPRWAEEAARALAIIRGDESTG